MSNSMKNKIIYGITSVLCLILVMNVIRSYISLSERGSILSEAELNLQNAKTKNEGLKRELAMVESPQYVEKEARDKLNLVKNGEVVVLLPSTSPPPEPTPTIFEEIPNWEKWRRVFF